jgi:hypothetical protein
MRCGRFVSTSKVCRAAAAMTANTVVMYSFGTSSWNRSDTPFTRTRRGSRQLSGCLSRSGFSCTVSNGTAYWRATAFPATCAR